MSPYRSSRVRPHLQLLEGRLTPATAALANGTLTINFTTSGAFAETVLIANNGSNLTLSGSIAGQSVPAGSVSKIVATDSGNGTQQCLILSGSPFTLPGGLVSTGVDDVTLNANVNTKGSAASISAPNDITISAGITTAGGAHSLIADSDGDGHGVLKIGAQTLGMWQEQTRLFASDGDADENLNVVAISANGNTAFLGVPSAPVFGPTSGAGQVYAFARQGNSWVQQQKLVNPDQSGFSLFFGRSIALSADGNTAIVGAPSHDGLVTYFNPGAAYVYTRISGVWSLQQKLTTNSNLENAFGLSVSLSADGNVALIGESGVGRAHVFSRSGGNWSLQHTFEDPYSTGFNYFGFYTALSADGHTAVVGGDWSQDVAVYTQSVGGSWGSPQLIHASLRFKSAALSGTGDTLILAGDANIFEIPGQARIYSRTATGFILQQTLSNPDVTAGGIGGSGGFGGSAALSVDGTTAIVGAPWQNLGGAVDGAVHVFSLTSSGWVRTKRLTPADGQTHGEFGQRVAMSGDGSVALVNAWIDTVNGNLQQGSVFAYALAPAAAKITELVATGAGPGGGPHVKVFNPDGRLRTEFFAYEATVLKGVHVATGDIDGDGIADVVVAPGPGNGPHVRVFSVATGSPVLIREFFAFDASMNKGVYIATGDVDGDGTVDIVTSTGAGIETQVRVYGGGKSNTLPIREFNPYPTFPVGVTVAAGDFNNDGKADIVTGAEDGNPHVKVFDGANPANPLVRNFFPYDPQYAVGAHVATGDFNGDGKLDITIGTVNRIAPGGPHVKIYNGIDTSLLREFFADASSFVGGIRVAMRDLDNDGKAEVLTGTGPENGAAGFSRLRYWRGGTLDFIKEQHPYAFGGGIYVG